jgi:hypothetical protein
MTTTKAKTLSPDQNKNLSSIATVSGKIRYLASINLTRMEISKVLNVRYQWVRNVLITPVKNPKV